MEYAEDQARVDIVKAIHDAWNAGPYKDFKLYGENQTRPNMDEQKPVVEYEILFDTDEQATLAENPIVRTRGRIAFTVAVPEGSGTIQALQIRTFLKQVMKARHIGKVRTTIPKPSQNGSAKGWYLVPLIVPFRYDSRDSYDPPTP